MRSLPEDVRSMEGLGGIGSASPSESCIGGSDDAKNGANRYVDDCRDRQRQAGDARPRHALAEAPNDRRPSKRDHGKDYDDGHLGDRFRWMASHEQIRSHSYELPESPSDINPRKYVEQPESSARKAFLREPVEHMTPNV
jgi:hypothetical protein